MLIVYEWITLLLRWLLFLRELPERQIPAGSQYLFFTTPPIVILLRRMQAHLPPSSFFARCPPFGQIFEFEFWRERQFS